MATRTITPAPPSLDISESQQKNLWAVQSVYDNHCIPFSIRFIFSYFGINGLFTEWHTPAHALAEISAMLNTAQSLLTRECTQDIEHLFGVPNSTWSMSVLGKFFLQVFPEKKCLISAVFKKRYQKNTSGFCSFTKIPSTKLFRIPSKPSFNEIQDLVWGFKNKTVLMVEGIYNMDWDLEMNVYSEEDTIRLKSTNILENIHCACIFLAEKSISALNVKKGYIYIYCNNMDKPWPLEQCWFQNLHGMTEYMLTVYRIYSVSINSACKLEKDSANKRK